ncbi:MAG TPA: amidohydrolase [Flavobacteriales bacterium]|nr:amidohydrolase [Flavobacteriales bacterium]HRE75653.1 amidohydrolase [Flavobacteriales bacterium]HRJ36097.1 amidohydrolase [Flavobacteriales bacterium]HRJ39969.1 amidohydrolase [Flavobacteriales bacterium]
MKNHFKTIFLSFSAILLVQSCAHKAEDADLIVHNAHIYSLDETNTVYEAMAIKDGKIIELGPERQILNKYRSKEQFDAGKNYIYPGFIDAHGHLLGYGQLMLQCDLTGTNSLEEVLSKVEKFGAKSSSAVVYGRGWDQNDWQNKQFPDNVKLSQLFPDRPVVLSRIDGHAVLVNNKALELAGVDASTSVEGGDFIKNADGKLTGVLIDNAIERVLGSLPVQTDDEIRRALETADRDLVSYGITTVSDAGVDKSVVDVMHALMKDGSFKLRVYAMMRPTAANLEYYSVNGPYKDDRLNIRSFKFMADGALGSWGACLKEPYHDAALPGHRGKMTVSLDELRDAADLLNESGFQVNTHCIGDSANKAVLSIYAEILGDMNDKRWRIEHAQILDTADINYFFRYSIIPSVQPTHAISDMPWAENRIGASRMIGAYAYRTLLNTNGWIALGTDFPVEHPDPLMTFFAAVFRKDRKGNPADGFLINERLSREEALRGMTIWAAKSNFEEDEKGSLEKGKFADFVVLNQDLLNVREKDFFKTQVNATYINGERVYSYK